MSWSTKERTWKAKGPRRDGKQQSLGCFVKEEDAAAAAKAAGAVERKPSSAHRGVTWHKATGKWRAQIGLGGGKQKHLGSFEDEEAAAAAVEEAAAERDA